MVREREITVFVIDDDKSVQRALARLLGVADFHVVTFSSVDQFLSLQEWPAFLYNNTG